MTDDAFTDAEAKILGNHFSNTDGDIFVITTPSQADRGALMSRYSRSPKGMRRVFLDEFLENPDRGERFYERVLAGYGDDSVAELGTAQVAVEGLSNIAVQRIEDRRIGFSFLEKSSRYVPWDERRGGRYAYYRGPDIMGSRHEKGYEEACDLSFDTYSHMLPRIREYVSEMVPIDDMAFRDSEGGEAPFHRLTESADIRAAERAYKNSVGARALDLVRGLLPASTLTNVGVTGNGRAFEYLISVLRSSTLREEKSAGNRLAAELKGVMGPFIRRADGKYGRRLERYLKALGPAKEPWPDMPAAGRPGVRLASYRPRAEALDDVITGLCYGDGAQTFPDLRGFVSELSPEAKIGMIRHIAGLREGRRHRPPRAFEVVSYVFDMEHNFGMYRDLHRHRLLTMQRQPLGTAHGYDMPPEIEAAGCSGVYAECMQRSAEVYGMMAGRDRLLAQYVVNFAYRCRYMVCVNLRELCHMVELRTLPQGHEDYRAAAISMYRQVAAVHPELAEIMKFVDTGSYVMGRAASEGRAAAKAAGTPPQH